MTSEGHHKREFTRVPVHVGAEADLGPAGAASGRVEDLSLRGLSIVPRDGSGGFALSPEVGTPGTVRLFLETGGDALEIRTDVRVTRVADDLVAFEFLAVDPVGFEHLQKLILYNSADAGEMEQEFVSHPEHQPRLRPPTAPV